MREYQYWIINRGVQEGPYSMTQIREMCLPGSTPVWRSGLNDWSTLDQLPELAVAATPPPIPAAESTPHPWAAPSGYQGMKTQAISSEATTSEEQKPAPTLLGWSVAATLLCCTILGIVAIVYSVKVRNANIQGDFKAAWKAYHTLELWLIATIVLGLVGAPLSLLIQTL